MVRTFSSVDDELVPSASRPSGTRTVARTKAPETEPCDSGGPMLRAAQVTHLDEDISIDVDERDTRGDHEPSGAILMKESFPPSVGQTGSRASLPASRPATAGSLGAAMQLGKYRLIAVLARGGMGDVYLAIAQGPLGFNKLLVVKELRQHSPEVLDDTAVTMF